MASLYIDFSYDDNVKRNINGAKSSLSTRINDYAGIKKSISKMSSSTGNLTAANTYIQKKMDALQKKHEKLENFRVAVTSFNANAEAADRRVANRINTETKQFYKREGIKTGILYTIGSVIGKGADWLRGKIEDVFESFVTGAKTVWANIKQWYEDNKHWIDVVIDVVSFVVAAAATIAAVVALATATAVTSGLVLSFVFAAWGLAKATADLGYDSVALSYYNQGDLETYEEMSQKGLKDFMSESLGSAGEYLYYGMEIASAIYGIYKIGKTATRIFEDYKSLYTGNLYEGNSLANMVLSDGSKRAVIISDIKLTIFKAVGIVNLDAATGQLTAMNLLSTSEWTLKTIQSILTAESFSSFTINSVKVLKSFDKIFSNIQNIIDKCSQKKLPAYGNLTAVTV